MNPKRKAQYSSLKEQDTHDKAHHSTLEKNDSCDKDASLTKGE